MKRCCVPPLFKAITTSRPGYLTPPPLRYSLDTVDCVKVLRSREPRKTVALRFLQLRLSNDSFTRNAVQMYAGDYFDADRLIGEVTAMSPEDRRSVKYETLGDVDTLGVRVMSSPATGEYGFIAEVVTLPLSPGLRPDLGASPSLVLDSVFCM